MSNSASISAAKKRRGGAPPPLPTSGGGAQNMSLPPGLPPNFRQLPPHIQQQLFQQLQQKMNPAMAAAKVASPQAPTPMHHQPVVQGQAQQHTQPQGQGVGNNVPGPYTVNSVIHNRAMAEVNGIHIRDLPISSAGLPCLPSGGALPPNILFKLHHDELLNMDAILNEHSNKIQMLSNKLDKGENIGKMNNNVNTVTSTSNQLPQTSVSSVSSVSSYDSLVNNSDFITKILDNILTNTNLSDIINQIEPLQKENESLRALLNSQQVTLNELSGLVMKLLSNGLPSYNTVNMCNSYNYESVENVENVENIENSENTDNVTNEQNNNDKDNDHDDENTSKHPKMEYSVYIPESNNDEGNNLNDIEEIEDGIDGVNTGNMDNLSSWSSSN